MACVRTFHELAYLTYRRTWRTRAWSRMIRLSVNVNKVATLRNSRGGSRAERDAGGRDVSRRRRAGNHRASARRTSGTSARRMSPTSRRLSGIAAMAGARRRVQHRRRSAARLRRPGARDAPGSVHAGAGHAGRDHESGRLARGHRARARCATSSRGCKAPACASACSSIPICGAVDWAAGLRRRSHRALHRAVRARLRDGRSARGSESFARYVAAAEHAHALGLGVNAGHDLDLDNLRLFRDAAAPRRGVDRPRAHQPRAVGRTRPRGAGLPGRVSGSSRS